MNSKKPNAPNSKRNINSDSPAIYKCTRCGKTRTDPKGFFFMSKTSPLFVSNELYTSICSDCANELYENLKIKYKDEKMAMMIICHYLDVYFSEDLYEQIKDNANFSLGNYLKHQNLGQYKAKNFSTFFVEVINNGLKGAQAIQEEKETKWSKEEIQNRETCIETIGYDPFEGYSEANRRFLFNELIKYFDEDIEDDTYKLSQVIQIVNNNNQIRNYDLEIARLSAISGSVRADEIEALTSLKRNLVMNNDKIAKENEISVKNRSNKDVGKSTLGKLQIKLRKMNFNNAEENYYSQLRSEGTKWAIDMSHKSIIENAMFDENDKQEIFNMTRERNLMLQNQLDDEKETNRLLQIELDSLKNKDVEN